MATQAQKTTLGLYRSFIQVARQWPADKVRKDLQFGDALRAATHRTFLRAPPPESQLMDRAEEAEKAASKIRVQGVYVPRTASQNSGKHSWVNLKNVDDEKVLDGGKNLRVMTDEELKYARRSLQSLQHILNNRPSTKFPTPEEVIEPPSMPTYYTRLRTQVEYAEQGRAPPSLTPYQKFKIFMGYKPHQV